MTAAEELDAALRALGIPIKGVRLNGGTPTVNYAPEATAGQITQGNAFAATFDMSDSAQAARVLAALRAAYPEFAAALDDADAATATNDAFLALPSPTNLQIVTAAVLQQVLSEVKALARQNNRIIPALVKLVLRLDTSDADA